MKKLISIFCVFAVVFSACSVFAYAADAKEELPYENSQYFEIGDYSIHYRVFPAQGTPKGRIMMLHGFLCSTYAWRNMVPILNEAGYDCVLADLPNFGFSTRENKDTEIIDREDIVVALMESIAPTDEWIIAGHSMGGGVAVNVAIEEDVEALLLYCPAPQSEFPKQMKGLMTSGPMKFIMNLFFNYGTRIVPLVKMIIYAATMDWKFAMDYDVTGVTDATQHDGFGGGLCEMMFNVKATQLDRADEVDCPVFICQASKDIIINQTMKDQMNGAFPDATSYLVEGGGHQCIENRADEICEATLAFLIKSL